MIRFSKTLNRISEEVEGDTAQQVRYSLPEMIFLEVKDSKELEERQRELEYFKFVSAGDIEKVNECLTGDKKVSVNCINYQGLSALHLALKNNDTKMVEYLLKRKDLDLMDCALYAVKLNQTDNVERIFNKLKAIHPSLEFSPCINSAEFAEYLTPLMVAAQCGHIEMIHFLFSRGHPEISQPHKSTCVCSECVTMMKELDPLLIATKTFDTYKAICSHAYIPNVTNDPILMVFHLVEELKEQAVRYRLFHSKYDELIEDTEKFAADLIAFCRNTTEVSTVLMTKEGSDIRGNIIFPRLVLAVEYDQKLFVAETNVQEVLQTAWVEDWYAWRNYSKFKRSLFIIGRMISIIYVCFTCLFRPKSDDAKFYNIPVNRMVTSVSSYIYFLILLYLESSQEKKDQTRYDILDDAGLRFIIIIFVISYIMSLFRMWVLQGTKRFFSFSWNIYDLVTQLLFMLTATFWICAIATLSWQPDLERKYWHYLDPQLLAEGFFCIGTVMAFFRLLFYVQLNHALGPLQISLGKMTVDFSQFLIIFIIVIGSFTAGLCRLFEYYDGMIQIDPESNATSRQESSFINAYDTFTVLFWGLFCMSSQEAGIVVIENLPSEGGELEAINTHDFTQMVGYCLFAVYCVFTVIVLMNMLIGAMSNTFQRVTDNLDVEWIFARTEIYLTFMSQTVLPPPLNFLPTRVGASVFSAFRKKFFKIEETPREDQENFESVMGKLVARYFSKKRKEEASGEKPDSSLD